MSERVIKVFYNGECLPFKDKERVVHYPVAQGHIFMGASNTTEIRFYCDQIGGGSNQWIVIGKLPNGKRGFHILGNYLEDEDGGYYSFHLSQFFTQYKGDLYLSLGGYNGNIVELNQEEEYELTGNTLIETTGSIRLTIEYSTPINGSDDEIDTWQEFLGALGEKADKGDVILPYISYAILESDYDNYDNGQFYFCEETRTIYRKVSGALTPVLVVYNKQQIDNLLNDKVDKLTTSGVYAYIHNGSVQGELAVSTPSTGDTIAKRESDGRLKVATPTSDGDATTKGYVDNLIDTIKSGELEIVDTTTYPTLNDFLATTGEEGHIYLYPIDINDLTKGYYRYVWEEISGTEQWVSLGTTEIDLSDYYTKTQADNKFVEQVSGKGLSSNDFTDNDKNKLDGIESGAEVNIIEEIKVDNVALTPTDKSVNIDLSGKQDLLISGTNIKTLNNTSLLGSGNIDYDNALSDSSTNAVQNKVLKGYLNDIGNRLAVLEESIISDDNLNYTYLSDSAIPASVNTYPIIESAGMDNTNIKGNSFVWNQILLNTMFEDTSEWYAVGSGGGATLSTNSNVLTLSINNNSNITGIRQGNIVFQQNHTYLVYCLIKASVSNAGLQLFTTAGNNTSFTSVTNSVANTWQTLYGIATINNATSTASLYFYCNKNSGIATMTCNYKNAFLIDITQVFPIDTPTTTDDPRVQWAIQYAQEHPEYNAGIILNSKPTALISKSFNIWDEVYETGAIGSDGTDASGITIRVPNNNKIKVLPNTTYCFYRMATTGTIYLCYYDKEQNVIGSRITLLSAPNQQTTFTTPSNCYYIRFSAGQSDYTDTNKICINISNATLNGTYRPYKAPITYPLSLPDMRSVGSVQDDVSKANVNIHTFGDNESIDTFETSSGNCRFRVRYYSVARTSSSATPTNIICDKASIISPANWFSMKTGITIGITGYGSNGTIQVSIEGVSTAEDAKAWLNGKTIYYEARTPTDQPAITLPENIEFEKGGSLEVTYDETAPTPADFDFEVAVYKPIQ